MYRDLSSSAPDCVIKDCGQSGAMEGLGRGISQWVEVCKGITRSGFQNTCSGPYSTASDTDCEWHRKQLAIFTQMNGLWKDKIPYKSTTLRIMQTYRAVSARSTVLRRREIHSDRQESIATYWAACFLPGLLTDPHWAAE
jgi:hypothetical protein